MTASFEAAHCKPISTATRLTRRAKHPKPGQPLPRKYSHLPKFGITVFIAHPGPRRGAIVRRHERGSGCGGRGCVGHARREQGEMNLVRSRPVCGTDGANIRPSLMAEPEAAYGKTMWS
nr:hypothetical protein BDOA9_0105130 [Bradyrhizobium sp. DOA9]